MKRILLAGVAAATMASSASAGIVNIPITQGTFNINVNGVQPLVCRIDYGSTSGNATVNFAIANLWSVTWANLDTNADAQLDAGRTASLALNSFICNTNFTVAVDSLNGGMENLTTSASANAQFTDLVDYNLTIPGIGTAAASTLNGTAVSYVPVAFTGGSFTVDLLDPGKYLLAGVYSDVVTITINPSL